MTFQYIPLKNITGTVYQPRHQQPRDIEGLMTSILTFGLVCPVTVRQEKKGYRLICGSRRFEALQRICDAGKAHEIPSGNTLYDTDEIKVRAQVLADVDDSDAAFMAFIENEEREDLTPLDKAFFYMDMVDNFGKTTDYVASRLQLSSKTIEERIALLKSLPQPVLEAWQQYRITSGHVQSIMALETTEKQLSLLDDVLTKSLNVIETEMASLRLRDHIPNTERMFRAMEEYLYKQDSFKSYIDQGKIRLKGSRTGKWISMDMQSPTDFKELLAELLAMMEEFPVDPPEEN